MRIVLITLLATILCACAGVNKTPEPVVVKHLNSPQEIRLSGQDNYWWHARFKMLWPEAVKVPDFSKDLIIVNELITPVLAVHADDIKLWRFHRRALRDTGGLQFSFIFYGSPETAREIFNQIDQNPVLAELINEDILLELKLDDLAKPGKKEIADTSDPSWPPSLQNSWPYFIMGVSVMYLDLAQQELDQERLKQMSSVTARLNEYQAANDRLTLLWKEQGSHALFHHISAIFGYETLEVQF
jgi:hypothetical protein